MKRPDFSKIDWKTTAHPSLEKTDEYQAVSETNEQISIKAVYGKEDLTQLPHMPSYPGVAPYTRGPYAAMYVNRPWTVRQ